MHLLVGYLIWYFWYNQIVLWWIGSCMVDDVFTEEVQPLAP